ncbi:tetratricopeptide repeat protein [Tropicibacter oceani]|uniref:Tetratricopeptide repeat protein n=1 Tax=Tropicibacter oceani TaxID=3058420 RepID=A0ABY8QLD9_9RHOB|nr:tetratricopeptide repeat protein [Tropicibacter oceani]WGW05450.1 hypothetical protein QF118_07850 [Tropicibacter oceani]
MKPLLVALCLLAPPVLADGCPVAPDHSAELGALLQELKAAPNEMAARGLSNRLWQLWSDAPDEPSQTMLDEGMAARGSYDFARALDRFDRLVGYCPFYAEGYNQRAFIHFLREDYEAALPDLEETLRINPQHVGALAGKALTLLGLGRELEGQKALRAALALNPWLTERGLLKPLPGEEL